MTRGTRRRAGWCFAVLMGCAQVARADENDAPATTPAQRPDAPPASTAALVPPALAQNVELVLPEGVTAPAEGVEVVLEIDAEGAVRAASLRGASLGEAGDQAVLDAAYRLRFLPAQRDGQPVPALVAFRFAVAAPPTGAGSDGSAAGTATAAGASAAAGSEPGPDTVIAQADGAVTYGATAEADKPEPGAASRVTLRGAELTNIPGTFGEPMRVVATLPGVARSPFGLGFFLVRGANFQNTGFLVDSYPVPLLYHLGAGPAILPARLVEKLDFYPGGYPAAYGRYTAGLVSLTTAPPPLDSPFFEFEVDLLRAGAVLAVPFANGRGVATVAYRRSYYELLLPLINDDIEISYSDYQVRLDYQFDAKLHATLFFFGSRDALSTTSTTGAGSTTGKNDSGLGYSFDQLIGELTYEASRHFVLSWSGTAGPSSIDFGSATTGDPSLDLRTDSLRIGQRLQATITPNSFSQTTFGVEESIFLTDLLGTAPAAGDLPAIPAPTSSTNTIDVYEPLHELTLAPYIEQVFRPERFEITAAMRTEHYSYGDVKTWTAEPRGVVRYSLLERVTLKAATGLFSQAPLPFQLARSFGNPDMAPNRAWQSSVGTEIKLPFSLEIDSSLFLNRMWQLTRAASNVELNEDGTVSQAFLQDDGEGRAYGWELLLRRRVAEGLFGWVSYTLSRSERFLPGGPATLFSFDQPHVLNLAVSYKTGGWRFGTRFLFASGRPVSDSRASADRSNVVYDADDNDYVIEPRGRTRLPAYNQLDVRVDRDYRIGPLQGSVFLDIINVYNAHNSEGWNYAYDYSARVRQPGLPFLPTIGIRGVVQ